ncbi:unnamed protein product [Sphagnum balticum]
MAERCRRQQQSAARGFLGNPERGGFHFRTLQKATTIGCSRILRQSVKRRILRQSVKRRIPLRNVADGNNNRLLEDSSAVRKRRIPFQNVADDDNNPRNTDGRGGRGKKNTGPS